MVRLPFARLFMHINASSIKIIYIFVNVNKSYGIVYKRQPIVLLILWKTFRQCQTNM